MINQINKHKAKIYNHCTYAKIIIKNVLLFQYIIISLFLLNIRMINLSLNQLKLIAQIRNISDYENKFKEDLIKALNESKPETTKKHLKQNQKQHQSKHQNQKQNWK